ncbi:hypothetical protein ATI61_103283 [Archangium gephyra]|uniref:Uncharacterized protein n=1 Tax=Archangium gephyra TaxID=48 RepID=A0AAC8TD79_9BACT|nr:hypothetical protein [Archangium gephyra]AKJ01572.1 Hypothetical protein AA314_03198 [Archangium gephyra]REG34389.1 hypothetical protein ATI61_103283 [Archangium gephyra]
MRYIGVLVMVLASGLALAQSAPRPPPASVVLPAEKASDVPDAQKLERSSKSLGAMREVLRDVLAKLEEARRAKDVVKLNCVNEKLTQIKGLLRISEQSDVALQEAVSTRDATSSAHEYTKVMIAQQKVSQLRTEAEKCIGQLAFQADENMSVEVEEPTNLPGGDPTHPAPVDGIEVRPPPSSAVQ